MGFRLIISDYTQELVPNLPDAEAAWLLRALVLFAQSNGEDVPREIPPTLAIVWPAVEKRQRALLDAYNETCDKRKRAAEARWEKERENRSMQKHTGVCKSIQPNTDAMQKEKEKEKEREKVFPEERSAVPAPARVEPPRPRTSPRTSTSVDSSIKKADRPFGANAAEDFDDPVDFAIAVTGEAPDSLQARYCYGSYLRALGRKRFTDAVIDFRAECAADGRPDKPGAALNAKLRRLKEALAS